MKGICLRIGSAWMVLCLMTFMLAAPCAAKDSTMIPAPDDEELPRVLPGTWTYAGEPEEVTDQEMAAPVLARLALEENGNAALRCVRESGASCTYEGTWSFDPVTDESDRLTLLFTSTDDPALAGDAFRLECVYGAYTEAWTESNSIHTTLILEEISCSGSSPFTEAFGWGDIALDRIQGPNRRVVNCRDFVSLREKRSKTSKRLVKVPLGALVLAFPEEGEKGGFISCLYGDQFGFILSEYLQPAEVPAE